MMNKIKMCACVALVVFCTQAQAFKLTTHVWLAKQLHQEISAGTGVKIDGRVYNLKPTLQRAIKRQEGAFVMGVLGADVYPDMIAGQMTVHPGVSDSTHDNKRGWQTDDWIRFVIAEAYKDGSDEALAFAAGYALHAAMDMWAHTYVNLMVGDVFSIKENAEAAERHVAIETYFTKFHENPVNLYSSSPTGPIDYLSNLKVPAEFVRKTLILNPTVRGQYHAGGIPTSYLAALNDYMAELSRVEGIVVEVTGSFDDELDKLTTLLPQIEALEVNLKITKDVFQSALQQHLGFSANQLDLAATELEGLDLDAYLSTIDDLLASHNLPQIPSDFFNFIQGITQKLSGAPPFLATQLDLLKDRMLAMNTFITDAGYAFDSVADFDNFKTALQGARGFVARAPFRAQRNNVNRAMDNYVVAWEDTAKNIMRSSAGRVVPGGKAEQPILKWSACWMPTLVPQPPAQFVAQACDRSVVEYRNLQHRIDEAKQQMLSYIPLVSGIQEIIDALNESAMGAAQEQLVNAMNNWDLIENVDGAGYVNWAVRMWDKAIDARELDLAFTGHTSSAPLLKRPPSTFVHQEFGACTGITKANTVTQHPVSNFAPMQNAMVMAKLTLLPAKELNRLISHKMGGITQNAKTNKTASSASPNAATSATTAASISQIVQIYKPWKPGFGRILDGALRSIDGDHQWLDVAPPLPRATPPNDTDKNCRHFGYPKGNKYNMQRTPRIECQDYMASDYKGVLGQKKGFALYNIPSLRDKVFRQLFKPVDSNLCEYAGSSQLAGMSCSTDQAFPNYNPNRAKPIQKKSGKRVSSRRRLTKSTQLPNAQTRKRLATPRTRSASAGPLATGSQPVAFNQFSSTAKDANLNNAYLLSLLSYVAYPGALSSKPTESQITQQLDLWGLKLEKWIDKKSHGRNSASTQVVIASNAQNFFIAYRGSTITAADKGQDWWDNDLDFTPHRMKKWHPRMVMHDGFFDAAMLVQNEVLQAINQKAANKKIWLTGHSLGGAAAVIAGFGLMHDHSVLIQGVHIFGAPPAGNNVWAQEYRSKGPTTHRWSLQNDPVALFLSQVPGPLVNVGARHNLTKKATQLNATRDMVYPLKAGAVQIIKDLSSTHMGYWCRLLKDSKFIGAVPPRSECDLCTI